ncbi:MAG TPA: ScyD/ScyE family protein [Candidatus Nanopelagicales bacterium]|nr:ScyD/ScyE family protein [Candidatus Nanopelagicales bacterium]
MRRTSLGVVLGVSALTVAGAAAAAPAGAAAPPLPPGVTVLAAGFQQPAHVAFGPRGTLYVADIGSGAISKVSLRSGRSWVVTSSLGFAAGIDVGRDGHVYATSVLGDPETGPVPARVVRLGHHGKVKVAVDTFAWEKAHNPDGQSQTVDSVSNPYSVLKLKDRLIVVDAGANDMLEVRGHKVRTLTVFPVSTAGECATRPENDPGTFGCDPVPTDVEMGRDGYLYVSGLGAFAAGHIWKVDPRSGKIVRSWDGLPPLTGLAVGANGTIYAASLVANQVLRIRGTDVDVADIPGPADAEYSHGMLVVSSFAGLILKVDGSAFHEPV